MIESSYWRAELRSDLKWLKSHRRYRRWSEKQQVLYERKIMLVAFQVRSLLERPKVNDIARMAKMPALSYKKIGDRPFTVVGAGWPHERFDMEHPQQATLTAVDVCNQIIHYYWMQTGSEGQTFASMLVFSDYGRHKAAYELKIANLLQLFDVFADESSAIIGAEFRWNGKKQDYVLAKAVGPSDASAN